MHAAGRRGIPAPQQRGLRKVPVRAVQLGRPEREERGCRRVVLEQGDHQVRHVPAARQGVNSSRARVISCAGQPLPLLHNLQPEGRWRGRGNAMVLIQLLLALSRRNARRCQCKWHSSNVLFRAAGLCIQVTQGTVIKSSQLTTCTRIHYKVMAGPPR